MFNLKVICLVSCLVVVATAQFFVNSPKEVKGAEKVKAIRILKEFLKTWKENGKFYTVTEISTVKGRPFDGGIEYTFVGRIEDNRDRENICTVILISDGKSGKTMTIQCK